LGREPARGEGPIETDKWTRALEGRNNRDRRAAERHRHEEAALAETPDLDSPDASGFSLLAIKSFNGFFCALESDSVKNPVPRSGHQSYDVLMEYVREAENLRNTTFGEPFPPLPEALLAGLREEPSVYRPHPPSRRYLRSPATRPPRPWRQFLSARFLYRSGRCNQDGQPSCP
jgi:hypothetical protein